MDGYREIKPRRPADYSAAIDGNEATRVRVWRRRGYAIIEVSESAGIAEQIAREERHLPRGIEPPDLFDLYESWGREILAEMQLGRRYHRRPVAVAV